MNDEPSHYYCCNPDKAICGFDLAGGDDVAGDPLPDCLDCQAIDKADVPCHARFCRLRSWWRERRPW